MYKVLTECPVCSSELKITKLECSKCKTKIENDFVFSKFEKLNKEQLKFIEVFLSCRGNIKDVEKELGISYPTVRGKLDDVNKALGINKNTQNSNKDIIDMLENGDISSKEAIDLLNKD